MDSYITKDGKTLRCGYTTGSCAAAASKAAALMLLGGGRVESVFLMTPKGQGLTLMLTDIQIRESSVSCAVVKDSGDDPDVTNGISVYAEVSAFPSDTLTVEVDGGRGVGRVTKPGLDQPVGNAAINSVPRAMIERQLREAAEDYGYSAGLRAVISVPDGEGIAAKTFNPRLGIAGGISILGTTGIVEPMSDAALTDTIAVELSMHRASGDSHILLTPGNYGEDYIKNALGLDPELAVKTSNFIGDAIDSAIKLGFTDILIVGHIGKLIKLAGGMMNTHSRYGDCRAEIIAAHAGACGAGVQTVRDIMESVMTDDMLDILHRAGLREAVMESVTQRIIFHIGARIAGRADCGVVVFSNKTGLLGQSPNAEALIKKIAGDK